MIKEYEGNDFITYGKVVTFDISMEVYSDRRMRTIRVWLPESYDGKRRFPVLYMHDAQNLFDGLEEGSSYKWSVNRKMEVLEKEGLSAIIVGIDGAPTRFEELCPDISANPAIYSMFNLPKEFAPTGNLYAEFITGQLKSFVDEKFMTLPDAANTAVGGASMGGLISLYMLLKYPGVFNKAMVFSPNFIIHMEKEILRRLELYDFSKLQESRIFIFHGGQELEAMNWPYVQTIFETMRDKGMDETQLALLYDSRQPHYESAWEKYFTEAFCYLFMKDDIMNKSSNG